MSLVYALRIHLAALATFAAFSVFGLVAGAEAANVVVQGSGLKYLIVAAMYAWILSWLWLLIQSWVMLLRSWGTRTTGENMKLFLILFIFNFLGTYYFYWKRYEIDPKLI